LTLAEAHSHAGLRAELALWMGNAAVALDEVLIMLRALEGTDGPGAAGNLFTLGIRACADMAEAGNTDEAATAFDELASQRRRARTDPFGVRSPKRQSGRSTVGGRNSPASCTALIRIPGRTPRRPGTS
jgi:hypothetical protein